MEMKKPLIYLIVGAVVLVGIIVAFSTFAKTSKGTGSITTSSECSQFSNKDGYKGCMSLVNGKEKKCKFKIENKVNEVTQKMEFTYTCLQK
ncbi:MAG: hypothetical protein COY68_03225 [Candidatus Levybacteria bacterium CG_4_10_14_0_8_um_filter_35_23]|nr:MAG: hypothetical protein COY68_03225 [Candidatus Levybacteria bacterium CG_4_10_14_0_8_um_filter_35_23]